VSDKGGNRKWRQAPCVHIEIDEQRIASIIDNAPRLSLAGAQSKFAVFRSFSDRKTYYRSDDAY
jgi:hypothetical protein